MRHTYGRPSVRFPAGGSCEVRVQELTVRRLERALSVSSRVFSSMIQSSIWITRSVITDMRRTDERLLRHVAQLKTRSRRLRSWLSTCNITSIEGRVLSGSD
ncbi:hypothetical protein GB937_006973 [Aspergillus fischeri]|nr:hypothetical protein GB937_006973 [Aspergillus fischeri]